MGGHQPLYWWKVVFVNCSDFTVLVCLYIFFMLDKITESEENINGTVVTFKGKFVLAANGNRLCVRAHFFFRWLVVCGANFAER